MVSIIGEKNLIFDRFYRSIRLGFFFLMTTISLIDVFCRQSIIGIDPIDVFLTIGAQLWFQVSGKGNKGNKGSKGIIVYITYLSYVYNGTNAVVNDTSFTLHNNNNRNECC